MKQIQKKPMSSWDPEWENIHQKDMMGKYPSEYLVRTIARHFYHVSNRKAIRILEIGCGKGAQIWFLAREGFSVFGVDGSPTAVKYAANRFDSEQLDGEIEVGDVIQLKWPDEFFDAVIDIECLMGNDWDNSKFII